MAGRRLPSFFKILLKPSLPYLPLPTVFVSKHLEHKIPENPILRSEYGEYSWTLKIEKVGEVYCFTDGWNRVVEDCQLGTHDFLVFWLVDQSTFKLKCFSPDGCDKEFPSKTQLQNDDDVEEDKEEAETEEKEEETETEEEEEEAETEEEEEDDEDDDDDDDNDNGGDNDGDPFFTTTMFKGHKCCMRLPLKFVRLAGIDAESMITMKNLDGKESELRLRSESKVCRRYYLSLVWSDFWRVNELSEGDKCVFKFIRGENKLVLATVTKKNVRAKQPAGKVPATEALKRTRGLPPDLEVESKEKGAKVAKKKVQPEQDAGKAPVTGAVKRPRGRPPVTKVVKDKVQSKHTAGEIPVAEGLKRKRGKPEVVNSGESGTEIYVVHNFIKSEKK